MATGGRRQVFVGSNIVAAQRKQLAGAPVASETSIIFSGQLYEYCRARGIIALFTSDYGAVDELDTPLVKFVNVLRRWKRAAGWRYHLSRIIYSVRLARMARGFGADVALIDSGSAHYFSLAIFALMGVPVAVNFHNVRWPQGTAHFRSAHHSGPRFLVFPPGGSRSDWLFARMRHPGAYGWWRQTALFRRVWTISH
jgi:hypothetical protein